MKTSYQDIYDIFISKITDYDFLNLLPEDIEDYCLKFLKSAIIRFVKCEKNLADRDDTLKEFNFELTETERYILGTMMIVEWVSPQVFNIINTKQFLGDKEYQFYSQANHLDKLLKLKEVAENDGERFMISYTYSNGDIGELR